MRPLIIQNRLGLEGRTRCVAEFVRLLNDLGEEPRIVCLTFDDPDIGRAFGIHGLRYELAPLLPWSHVPSAHRPEVLLTNLLARRMIYRLQPDLVFNSNNIWAFLPPGPRYIHYIHFPFKAGPRYMSRFNGGIWKSYASFLNVLVHESAPPPHSQFVANSEFVRAGVSEMYDLQATVIHPPAWDGQLRAGRPDLRRVVTLGSFHPDKAQLDQIEIARRLPDWHFTLLGSPAAPWYAQRVQREASQTQNVEVVLNPTKERICEAFANASHFVHNNPHEGFGIAAVEAAAAGCIPVVPNTGGVREIVESEQLRFTSIDRCVELLQASTGEAGRRLLAHVQQGLHRFGADTFRSAMAGVLEARPEPDLTRERAEPRYVIASPVQLTETTAGARLIRNSATPSGQEERTSFLGGSALLFWSQVASATGLFVAVLLLARGLGPEGRGTMAFISVAALIIGRIARIGVGEAVAILAAQRRSERAALLADLAVFVVPVTFVVASVIAISILLMPEPRPAGVGGLELVALVVGATGLALFESCGMFLLGCKRFEARTATGATGPWIYAGVLSVLAATGGLTVASAAFSWALAMCAGGLIGLSISLRTAGFGRPQVALLRQLIRLGMQLWVGTLTSFLNLRVDQLLMGFISTEATLGIYAVAVNGAEVLLYFPTAIGEALYPFLAVGNPREQGQQALRAVRLLALSTTASIAVAALIGPALIPVVFGKPFEASVVPFLWLLPGALGYAATRVFSIALATSSAPGRSSVPPLLSLVLGILLDLVLIPGLGAVGAAIAASAAYIAGGTSALLLHRARNPFAVSELFPRVGEVTVLMPRARAAFDRLRSLH
jgi:O-antigen/teichoic acid export membrane protein/glycosyltransferase involved in cell wall biosynthesis